MGNKVISIEYFGGLLTFTVDFWGSLVKIRVLLPDVVKRKIAAEVV